MKLVTNLICLGLLGWSVQAVVITKYPKSDVDRFFVPKARKDWSVPWPEYAPPEFTDPSIRGKEWADLDADDPNFHPKWNDLDGERNRRSKLGTYAVVDNLPVNPEGRTGIRGRGRLGKWGPNHAADAIVTRWLKTDDGGKVLQFIAIKRGDNGMWAIPGGMVDPGETPNAAMRREFMEECLNYPNPDKEHHLALYSLLSPGHEKIVYAGFVDDPRNTDQAWMETTAGNFHFDDDAQAADLKLQAGDDAVDIAWVDVHPSMVLHANHIDFVGLVAKLHGLPWPEKN